MESWFKIYCRRKDEKLISAVKPDFYRTRFVDFMAKQVFINENKDSTYNSDQKKLNEVLKIHEDFSNHYHKFYQCQHCGKTYND